MESNEGGLWDPDQWIDWWLELHPSEAFHGHLARLALSYLERAPVGSTGVEVLRFREKGEQFEVEVSYLIEEYPGRGRVFFVLQIRSEGDPLPPWLTP